MKTRDEVLDKLIKNKGSFVSGEEIASELGLSRMAISKVVRGLRRQGVDIQSRSKMGYLLEESADVLIEKNTEEAFEGTGVKTFFYDVTGSTNDEAKTLLKEGVKPPFVVVALRQRKGRGRYGREFVSSLGGVYFSLVLSSDVFSKQDQITISSCVAVSEVLEELTKIKNSIKWVNDIYINDKKAVGILTEGILNKKNDRLESVVIGCGINLKVKEKDFPESLKDVATSFYPSGEGKATRLEVLKECVLRIIKEQEYDYLKTYKEKCFVIGKYIKVLRGNASRDAYVLDIDDNGHLVVRYDNGEKESLSSGEVSIKVRGNI